MTNEEAIAYLERADTTVYAESKTRTAEALEMAIEALKERKTGKWVRQNDKSKPMYGWHFCTECGSYIGDTDGVNYCSWCGARMEVDE